MSDGLMSTAQRLVYMANQIARNVEVQGDQAAAMVADHLIQFWDPRMKTQIVAMLDDPASGLGATAREAVAFLAEHREAGVKDELAVDSAVEPMGGSDAG